MVCTSKEYVIEKNKSHYKKDEIAKIIYWGKFFECFDYISIYVIWNDYQFFVCLVLANCRLLYMYEETIPQYNTL